MMAVSVAPVRVKGNIHFRLVENVECPCAPVCKKRPFLRFGMGLGKLDSMLSSIESLFGVFELAHNGKPREYRLMFIECGTAACQRAREILSSSVFVEEAWIEGYLSGSLRAES